MEPAQLDAGALVALVEVVVVGPAQMVSAWSLVPSVEAVWASLPGLLWRRPVLVSLVEVAVQMALL